MTYKLISDEPTEEMLAIVGNEPEVFGSAEELFAALLKAAPEVKLEPVAFLHNSPGRVDVIHADVKKLLQDSTATINHLHRPIDKSEHYTIPLYACPIDAKAEITKRDSEIALLKNVIGKRTTEIARLKFVVAECERMFGLIASGNFLPLPCVRDGLAAIRELKNGA